MPPSSLLWLFSFQNGICFRKKASFQNTGIHFGLHAFFHKNLVFKNMSLVFEPKIMNKLRTSPGSFLRENLKFNCLHVFFFINNHDSHLNFFF